MKNLSFLLLSMLLLVSCIGNNAKPDEKKSTPIMEISTDSVDFKTIKAKFIEFRLGDAEHYSFEDESGKFWDFAGCEDGNVDFTRELNENEADESNQGWGSNKKLQGNWFVLTYVNREQPQYIDGPLVMVNIIDQAVLVDK